MITMYAIIKYLPACPRWQSFITESTQLEGLTASVHCTRHNDSTMTKYFIVILFVVNTNILLKNNSLFKSHKIDHRKIKNKIGTHDFWFTTNLLNSLMHN